MYELASPTPEVQVWRFEVLTRGGLVFELWLHAIIFINSSLLAGAFFREGPKHVPQALYQLITEPDARRALGERTAEFIAGVFATTFLWALNTGVFVLISLLVAMYVRAAIRRQYDHVLLKNKVHIALSFLGILPAWSYKNSPLGHQKTHVL
ncbi:hypothetical protein CC85DRAFT_59105 [Cutaneotrichosporon oleaginosum]|uniref:Uncharacterized protein n=1 Tax=Cutaneotrichosporon oleaginosum TaxID=879819 RepID=A0A0J0XYZ0_9TREE|nr:uncharacterized protein CC85DRAFT_59105 [Cutaneotrichosporon oleaginosum]KLT46278.1 hypothetical protein CC85DRAFT_59105 [Cutaneotrichosporon oleaginosum]TXT10282.1 hypothetical protein COLE_04216 [Cutaneotrichosporon oleaginosum]